MALDGGAGVTLAGGTANVIVTLPDGVSPVDGSDDRAGLADAGCDVLVVTGSGNATFADVRFARPEPVGGDAIDVAAAAQLFACEVGALTSTAALAPANTLFSAETDGSFALVDRTSVAASGFAGSIDAAITADDIVVVTVPAFVDIEAGRRPRQRATSPPAPCRKPGRTGLSTPFAPSLPHPTMEFLDAATSNAAATAGVTATVGAAAGLRHHHELPPHNLGHPGAPAAREAAGVGVTVNGAAALVVAEHTRSRANPGNVCAGDGCPAGATGDQPARRAERVGGGAAHDRLRGGGRAGTLRADPRGRVVVSRLRRRARRRVVAGDGDRRASGTFDPTGDVPRALSRRILAAGWGLREVATSLAAAFARAEDLVYLETPALDTLTIGATDDTIAPVQALVDRLTARPALHVVMCLPRRSPPGWPPKARPRP